LIIEILTNRGLYQKIVEQGSRELAPVSWESTSAKVIDVYRSLAGVGK
jgi:hypothetical protein